MSHSNQGLLNMIKICLRFYISTILCAVVFSSAAHAEYPLNAKTSLSKTQSINSSQNCYNGQDGKDGKDGQDGQNGQDGQDGSNCQDDNDN